MKTQPTILVCPMDWGLGHATRVVPIIDCLLEMKVRVVLGADNKPLEFLRGRFPQCEWVRIQGYKPAYQKRGSLALKVASDIPHMLLESRKAHEFLEKIIDKLGISAVISDNRYELWSARIPTVFMTHQLKILTQGILESAQSAIQKVLYSFIVKHDEVWVPDFPGEPNLSGELSHVEKLPMNDVFYIGPLSRFQKLKNIVPSEEKPDILCIMSGPEPQRSIFENILINQAEKSDYKALILSGLPGENSITKKGNVEIRSHSNDEEMVALIRSAGMVISRSGYTTVMDMAALGKKAVFIPTPGQPEQLYLAKRFKSEGLFYSVFQKDFHLEDALRKAVNYKGINVENDYVILNQRLEALLHKISAGAKG